MNRKSFLILILACILSLPISAKYSASGYITYTMSDATLKWKLPNTEVGGVNCTSVQGMAIGSKYLYSAKHKDNAYSAITRINLDTGSSDLMNYYSSLSATTKSDCDVLSHANGLEIVENVGANNDTWLFVATGNNPTAVARLKVVGNKMYFAGYYRMFYTNGKQAGASALKYVKTVGDDMYFVIKIARNFYTAKIPLSDTGGSASNPVPVTIYKLFSMDVRNTVFASSNTAYSTKDDFVDWVNQDFGYNPIQQVFYVPLWCPTSGSTNSSAIITYNVADYVIDENWENQRDINDLLFPTKTSFLTTNTSVSTFEMESAAFRTGKTDKLYFNINCENLNYEAVYEVNVSSTEFTPVNENKAVYSVKYNANGGTGSMPSTKHIHGIGARISPNVFTRTGYTFGGWYVHRAYDDKWLYTKEDGSMGMYRKGEQPVGAYLTIRNDKHKFSSASAIDGDVISLYAYWQPNTTGTKTFYVRYDANGGTGTMGETPVVYGTATKTATNAFTREGYTFVGWNAYRHNQSQWAYKNNSTFSDKWLGGSDDKTGYFLKTYGNGSSVVGSSSVDTDVVTFYASWAQITNGVIPQKVVKGSDFDLGGTLKSTTDLYGVIARVKNNAGEVVQSYSAETHASRTTSGKGFDLSQANSTLDFATLSEGNYTFEVVVQVSNGANPFNVTVHSSAFEVYTESPDPKPDPEINVTGLTEEWLYSTNKGNLGELSYFSVASPATRSMTLLDGKLYLLNATPWNTTPSIAVINAYDATLIKTLDLTGVSGGAAIASSLATIGGKVIMANSPSTTDGLKVYKWEDDNSAPALWLSDDTMLGRHDILSVNGDLTNGRLWVSDGTTANYYTVTNGIVSGTSTAITLSEAVGNQNGAVSVFVETDGSLWIDGYDAYATHFDANGNKIEALAYNSFLGYHRGRSAQVIEYGKRKYIADVTQVAAEGTATNGHGALALIDITDGVANAKNIGVYPSNGLGTTANSIGLTSVCHEITSDNNLNLWVMVPYQGIAMYQFKKTTSGIEDIVEIPAEKLPIEWYNLQGMRVEGENLTPGIYIRRQGNDVKKIHIQ